MPKPINQTGSMTFRLDAGLQASFMRACKAADLSAAQVLRAAIRDFVDANPQSPLPFGNVAKRGKLKGGKS